MAASRGRSRGEKPKTLSKKWTDIELYTKNIQRLGTQLSWLAAAQTSRASSLKAIRVELAVWSYRGPLHPTAQEA